MTLLNLNYLHKNSISKYSHLSVMVSTYKLWRRDMIQSIILWWFLFILYMWIFLGESYNTTPFSWSLFLIETKFPKTLDSYNLYLGNHTPYQGWHMTWSYPIKSFMLLSRNEQGSQWKPLLGLSTKR